MTTTRNEPERFDFSFRVEFKNSMLHDVQQFLREIAELAARHGAEAGSVVDICNTTVTPSAEK